MSSARPLREDLMMQTCLQACALVRRDHWLADRALDRALRQHRTLYSSERRTVAERVYALVRRQLTIDFLLQRARPGFDALSFGWQDLLRLCSARVLSGESVESVVASSRVSAEDARALRALSKGQQEIDSFDRTRRLSLTASIPEGLAEQWITEFGPEAERAAAAMNERAPLTARVNTLKSSRDELLASLRSAGIGGRPTALSPLGVVLETRINAFSLKPFKEGKFELQDEGSQLLGMLVDAPPKLVVDACAGAGGKTLQLAAQMKNRGQLFALDIHEERMLDLKKRARRAGAFNIRTRIIPPTPAEARRSIEDLVGRADRVLLDVPCSGTGSLRRNPDARYRISSAELEMQTRRQRELLSLFADLVRPGGRLIYGTCSVLREENEQAVDAFLSSRSDFKLQPAGVALGGDLANKVMREGCLRVAPHTHGTDGFFGALLQRAGQ
jgi:16S rRNA (cytosine967-C5)-methyltransferase